MPTEGNPSQEDPIRQVMSQAPKKVGVVLQVRLLSKVQYTSRT